MKCCKINHVLIEFFVYPGRCVPSERFHDSNSQTLTQPSNPNPDPTEKVCVPSESGSHKLLVKVNCLLAGREILIVIGDVNAPGRHELDRHHRPLHQTSHPTTKLPQSVAVQIDKAKNANASASWLQRESVCLYRC